MDDYCEYDRGMHPWRFYIYDTFGIHEPNCDADGLYDGLVIPPEAHWPVFWFSFIIIGTAGWGVYHQLYDFAVIVLSVWVTSVNYWRHPTLSWRRNMDMVTVVFSVLYHLVRAYFIHSTIGHVYIRYVIAGGLAYGFSLYTYRKSMYLSTLVHIIVHLIANIANWCLYSWITAHKTSVVQVQDVLISEPVPEQFENSVNVDADADADADADLTRRDQN